jgi:hypothetical protein
MRTLRWTFVIVLLLCLLPVIATAAGDVAATVVGCRVVELGCTVRGQDISDVLASLQLLNPLSIWGVMAALTAGFAWAVCELVAVTIGRNYRRLRF